MTAAMAGLVTQFMNVEVRDLLDKKAQLRTLVAYIAKKCPDIRVELDFDLPEMCRYELYLPDQSRRGLGCGLAADTRQAVFFDDYGAYDTKSLKAFTDHVYARVRAAGCQF